jgi:hypothetical protein
MNEILIPNARAYAAQRQIDITESLGSGKDGIVLVGKGKLNPARVALKAHRFSELYEREQAVYNRLKTMSKDTVIGFNVPRLINSDGTLLVLEMTIVERPFVLDFAGAYLDTRPEFSADIWADWEAEKREQFEQRWATVQEVITAFEAMGIYLLDVSPNNIAFLD